MQNVPTRMVFDVITDFLASEPSPEEIINYHLPEDLQERAHYLQDRNGRIYCYPMRKKKSIISCLLMK